MAISTSSAEVALASDDYAVHIHLKTIIIVIAICFLYFATLLSVVGSGVLAQSIGILFHGQSETGWFTSSITITTAILNLPLGQCVDYWGRKWVIVITGSFGFIGCLIISRAKNMDTVLAGFVILGLSFGTQSSLLSVVSEVVPRTHRPFAQAAANVSGGLGAVVGLVMGGSLIRYGARENYRVYFYVDAGVYAIAIMACLIFYNPPPRELQISLTLREKLQRLDWVGYALLSPGITLFCVALGWSQNPYSWSNAHILATFIIGAAFSIAFIIYEWRVRSNGALHHELFKSKNFSITFGTIFVEGLSFFTANSYFSYEVQMFTGSDFLLTCMHFSLVFFTTSVFSVLFGAYSWKRKSVRTPLVSGYFGLLLFNALMATCTPRSSKAVYWVYPVIAGIGLGGILPASMVAAQLSTPKELIAQASGLIIAIRSLGGAIGLAINTAIFSAAVSKYLVPKVTAATLPLGLPSSSISALISALSAGDSQALQSVPGITAEIIKAGGEAYKNAYSIAFRNIWIAAGCFAVTAIFANLFLTDPEAEFNHTIDAPAEKDLVEVHAA